MSTNEMDDFELFGGEPPAPAAGGAAADVSEAEPAFDPNRRQRASVAETAAAVARRKKEADRSALMHEVMVIGGLVVVLGVCGFLWHSHMQKKAELERQRHEYEMQEQAAQAERAKQARAEEAARREKLQKEKEEKAEALRKEREAKRAAEEAKREAQAKAVKATQRFKALLGAFRAAEIDYFKNAVDAERPDKVGAAARFICLMPGGGSGCDLYEIETKADAPMTSVRLTETGDPEPVDEKTFADRLKATPSLVLRDRGIEGNTRTGELKAYFLDPTRSKRGFKTTHPAPSADAVFSPSKEDFGALYDAVRALGCSRLAFKYKVSFKGGGLADPVPVKEVGLGDDLGRAAFGEAVRRVLEAKSRGRAVRDADVETVLRTGQVVFTTVR